VGWGARGRGTPPTADTRAGAGPRPGGPFFWGGALTCMGTRGTFSCTWRARLSLRGAFFLGGPGHLTGLLFSCRGRPPGAAGSLGPSSCSRLPLFFRRSGPFPGLFFEAATLAVSNPAGFVGRGLRPRPPPGGAFGAR